MEEINKAKEFLQNLERVKESTPCIILIGGEQVKLPSGKSAWKSIGAARSALTNALFNHGGRSRYPSIIRKELEKEGFIEFKTY